MYTTVCTFTKIPIVKNSANIHVATINGSNVTKVNSFNYNRSSKELGYSKVKDTTWYTDEAYTGQMILII